MNTAQKDPVQALITLLESGQYPPQSKMPPERALAVKLGITRTALRKALSTLEAQNRIWRHVGRGTFVGSRPVAEKESTLSAVTNTTHPADLDQPPARPQ